MSILDIIDNVDWNKNIIFFIIYITIVVLGVFMYLMPLMDIYKSVVMEYRKTNILDNQINATLEQLKGNETSILQENIAVFERLQHKADIKAIQKYARTYIKGAKVEDLGTKDAENGIKVQGFKIIGEARNLSSIKNLLAHIDTLPNSVRITFPITIHKDERRRVLNVEISLMVFNSTRDISKIETELAEFVELSKSRKKVNGGDTDSISNAKNDKESSDANKTNVLDIVDSNNADDSKNLKDSK